MRIGIGVLQMSSGPSLGHWQSSGHCEPLDLSLPSLACSKSLLWLWHCHESNHREGCVYRFLNYPKSERLLGSFCGKRQWQWNVSQLGLAGKCFFKRTARIFIVCLMALENFINPKQKSLLWYRVNIATFSWCALRTTMRTRVRIKLFFPHKLQARPVSGHREQPIRQADSHLRVWPSIKAKYIRDVETKWKHLFRDEVWYAVCVVCSYFDVCHNL